MLGPKRVEWPRWDHKRRSEDTAAVPVLLLDHVKLCLHALCTHHHAYCTRHLACCDRHHAFCTCHHTCCAHLLCSSPCLLCSSPRLLLRGACCYVAPVVLAGTHKSVEWSRLGQNLVEWSRWDHKFVGWPCWDQKVLDGLAGTIIGVQRIQLQCQ